MGALFSALTTYFTAFAANFYPKLCVPEASHNLPQVSTLPFEKQSPVKIKPNTDDRQSDRSVKKDQRRAKPGSMNVTRHNFLPVIESLEEIVRDCDFVSIDTELTGIRGEHAFNLFDLHEERYTKAKDTVKDFHVIQYGLTCWTKVDGQDHDYEAHCYNFYIFPQKLPLPKSQGDRTFMVQTSSLSFLESCGFDFNKLIRDGVSYMNFDEEKQCLEALEQQEKARKSETPKKTDNYNKEDKDFLGDVLEKVKRFVDDDLQDKLDLEPCNAFRRKIIYETLRQQEDLYDKIDVNTVTVSPNVSDRFISINKVDSEMKEKKQKELLLEALGFTKAVKLIMDHQKPVVGHNMFVDLMHTYSQFIDKLPDNYQEFKQIAHNLFPHLYDTKFISLSEEFKELIPSTALGDLNERLKKPPFVTCKVKLMNGCFEEEKILHEAGFDSYITGLCFLNLTKHLASLKKQKFDCIDHKFLSGFCNKLHYTYSLDIKYFNFTDKEPIPIRDHVYHITFPKNWKTSDLFQLFSAFGGVSIGWINDNSAFCSLKDEKQKSHANKSLLKKGNSVYKVISYDDYVKKTGGKAEAQQNDNKTLKLENSKPDKNSKTKARDLTSLDKQEEPKRKKSKSSASSITDKKATKSEGNGLFEEPAWDT